MPLLGLVHGIATARVQHLRLIDARQLLDHRLDHRPLATSEGDREAPADAVAARGPAVEASTQDLAAGEVPANPSAKVDALLYICVLVRMAEEADPVGELPVCLLQALIREARQRKPTASEAGVEPSLQAPNLVFGVAGGGTRFGPQCLCFAVCPALRALLLRLRGSSRAFCRRGGNLTRSVSGLRSRRAGGSICRITGASGTGGSRAALHPLGVLRDLRLLAGLASSNAVVRLWLRCSATRRLGPFGCRQLLL
mmetsp:Transcript_37208/g.111111  ORF Transcript_37208/g.111111 Transcript_37208/m.111111 type:complete len:254 (+) Transcript_37208:64-825(+)